AITVTNVDRAPVVTAPPTATAAEGQLLTVNFTAADPDGNAITSLTATGVPPGAPSTPGPGTTTGTLSWTPGFPQGGSYSVTFTASNALNGAGTTAITVNNTAPAVDAGANHSITLPAEAVLDGTVTDDGNPSPPALTTHWSVGSGPGPVAFLDAA